MANFQKLINMQDGIRTCRLDFCFFISENKGFEPKIPEINKIAGWNKHVQVGLFQNINTVIGTSVLTS